MIRLEESSEEEDSAESSEEGFEEDLFCSGSEDENVFQIKKV